MKYSAKLFLEDLKEADRIKTKQYRSKCKKRRKSYSVREEIDDAADEIFVVAQNERKFYEDKDAKGAVDFAAKQYLRNLQDDFRDIIKKAKEQALKDLLAYWRTEGHI